MYVLLLFRPSIFFEYVAESRQLPCPIIIVIAIRVILMAIIKENDANNDNNNFFYVT